MGSASWRLAPFETMFLTGLAMTVTGGSQSFPITAPGLTANGATVPLTNAQNFTITCTPAPADGPPVSSSITVEVIPVAQEV